MLSEKPERRRFVVAVEGPDYSGKSTVIQSVIRKLCAEHIDIVCYSRPGGTPKCDVLRAKITNSKMPPVNRQMLAMLEEMTFKYTKSDDYTLTILDRYNPISGQAYGPNETIELWRDMVNIGAIKIPDLVIFIKTPLEVLLERSKERLKRDAMDSVFITKSRSIVDKYDYFFSGEDKWFNSVFNSITVNGDNSFEHLESEIYSAIKNLMKG